MMRWHLPLAVSIGLHAAIGTSMVLVPPPSPIALRPSKTVEMEIVARRMEPVKAEEKQAPEELARAEVIPVEPVVPVKPAAPERSRRKRAPKEEPETSAPEGGEPGEPKEPSGGVEGAGGPEVGAPGPGGGTGKTKDGRDLSSLDLTPRLAVPKFEEQGPGVVIPVPKDPKRRPTKDGGWRYDDPTFGARVARDGSVTFDNRGHSSVDGIPDLGMSPGSDNEAPAATATWSLDVNDWILSAAGDDPYSYEKRKFLEATREERLEMARAACGERLSASLADLQQRLAKVWNSRRTLEEKRHLLFDLWDDCAEEGSPEVRRYGELARLTILDFIRKHLPKGSKEEYTELEIDRFNERRASSRRFAPYGGRM